MFKLSDFGVTRNTTTLSNGMRVVTFERAGMPLYIEALFFAGSCFDPFGKEGAAHFTEHVICSTTKKFPKRETMATFIEGFGGGTNAYTSSDVLGIESWVGDPVDLPVAVETITERIENPLINSNEVENERKVIHDEIGRYITKPDRYLPFLWNELIYRGHPSSHSVLGSHESLDAVTTSDIKKYHQDLLLRGHAVVVASGGIKIADVCRELEAKLTTNFSKNLDIPQTFNPTRDRFVLTRRYAGTDRVYFNLGFPGCPKDHEDKVALDLTADVIAGGMSSILMKRLRLERGLVYGVGAFNVSSIDRGSWGIGTSCVKDKFDEVIGIIIEEIDNLYNGKIDQDRLQLIKNHSVKAVRFDVQTSESWVSRSSFVELFYPDRDMSLPQYLNEESKVTLDDIKRVAKKYLQPGQWYFAATGDIEESDIKIDY